MVGYRLRVGGTRGFEMLDDSVRQADSLLTQQSRVSSDLQEGLMQTRMTPFGSAAPRLRRKLRDPVSLLIWLGIPIVIGGMIQLAFGGGGDGRL